MTLVRTSHGLENTRLFLSAEWVVYTEGGSQSFTVTEVEEGESSGSTLDTKFWSQVIGRVTPQKKVAVRSVGSKTTLHALIGRLAETPVSKVIVAMDSDYDCILDESCDSSVPIVRTYGYSWETDVWLDSAVVSDVIRTISSLDAPILADLQSDIQEAAARLRARMRWPVKGDVLLVALGSSGIRRDQIMRYIEVRGAEVDIRRDELAAGLQGGRQGIEEGRLAVSLVAVDSERYLLGHFSAHYWYHVVMCLIKKWGHYSVIDKKTVWSVAISAFAETIGKPIVDHYEAEFRRVGLI